MSAQRELLKLEERGEEGETAGPEYGELKLRRPERRQRCWHEIDVERLVGEDAAVRAIWELSGRFDLSGFASDARTREGERGRALWDPRLLVAIWIWAYAEGVSSAREIERQSRWRPELQWLCGLEVVNHHTLSDFRGRQGEALEEIFTQVLALLSSEGLVSLEQVAVDGTRIRAQAATSSERSRPTIERHLEQARAQVKRLREQGDDEVVSRQRAAAKQRAARERVERLETALEELRKVEAAQQEVKKNKSKPRVSMSEPEARRQRESNGGYATGYNAQLATDADNKIVVGVELTAAASDARQLEPTLADVERRLEQKPRQVLADEGYNSRANLEAMQAAEIEYVTPAPAPMQRLTAAARAVGIAAGYESTFFIYDDASDTFRCPAGKTLKYRRSSRKRNRKYRQYQARGSDCRGCEHRLRCCPRSYERGRTVSRATEQDAVLARHRAWMETERARTAYRRRSEVAEFPNAWLKERSGLRKFRLRGLRKARLELLWAVLAYNVRQWMRLTWRGPTPCLATL